MSSQDQAVISGVETAPGVSSGPDDPRRAMILSFFIIHNMAMRIGDRITSPIGLTSSRWLMLAAIRRRPQPPTITDLSRDAMLSVQNVSRMVATMEEEGLIERVAARPGGPPRLVRLTDAGQASLDATRSLGERFHEQFLSGLSPAEVQALARTVDRLIDNLASYESILCNRENDGANSANQAAEEASQ